MQLVVARIGRAHGIRGEVSVELRTDEPEQRLAPGAVLATEPPETGPLTVVSGRVHSGRLLLRFDGILDRAAAEALRNTLLLAEVDPDDRPEDPEEYYDHQLVGLAVVDTAGAAVGEVAEIAHPPGQDLLVVARPGGGEAMVPFVSELVPEVDLAAGRIVVAPPPGLLSETQAESQAEADAGSLAGGVATNDGRAQGGPGA